MRITVMFSAALLTSASPGWAQVGWRTVTTTGPGEPLTLQIWYPSAKKARTEAIGPFAQQVAKEAPVRGRSLPLVVVSHGSGGMSAYHHHSARALAEAGFVVVAPNHAGDTAGDMRFAGGPRQFAERARQVVRVIDYMVRDWPERATVDQKRIGLLGHSAGATTGLILAGGKPEFARFLTHCVANPQALDCRFAQERMRLARAATADAVQTPPASSSSPPMSVVARPGAAWAYDPRIKAVVAAAPAVGYVFTEDGLRTVSVPVQLWVGDKDEVTPAVWNADVIRSRLPKPAQFEQVAGGGHPAFVATCPSAFAAQAPEVCSDPIAFKRTPFHRRFNEAVVSFFRRSLPTD